LGGGQGGARSARAAHRGHDVCYRRGSVSPGGLNRARPLVRARETGARASPHRGRAVGARPGHPLRATL